MPRKTLSTQNLRPPVDATNRDILEALGKHSSTDVLKAVEELEHTAKSTHLGHELFDWDAEVDAD